MILQALTRYYDILADDPESGIAPFGYCSANVSFELDISVTGELLDVIHLFEMVQRGKKSVEVPRRMLVPEFVKRSSGVNPNFLCDNCTYVLGLTSKDAKDPDYAVKRFQAFRELNCSLLAQADCPEARALRSFLEHFEPAKASEHPALIPLLEEILKGGNLVFRVQGSKDYVHKCPQIRRVWELHRMQSDSPTGQCLITGETEPIARLHPSLKGVSGANATGATLVGFNARAYESYGKVGGQGLNSPVGEKAAFAYSTVLNYLLSSANPNRKMAIGDTTVVYWAESTQKTYASLFEEMCDPHINGDEAPQADIRDRQAELLMGKIAEKVRHGEALDLKPLLEESLDPDTRFYVLGLAPNSARISVRFFHCDPFLKIAQKMMQHYADLSIVKEFENQRTFIPLWMLLGETVSKKASNSQASPLMAGAVMRAILQNTPYPAALYNAIITRVRADQNDSKKNISKINYVRAAIIKAYLLRKYRNQDQPQIKEVLCMSLNEQSQNQAYLLGRMFAVLEKAQKDANPNLNATITDRYFTSACAAPATVFPALLRLSRHHISKAKYGYTSDRRIEEIMNLLDVENDPFPAHLTLDQQGIFVLGYYHQRTAFYVRKENEQSVEALETEN